MIGFLGKKGRGKNTAGHYFVELGYTERAFAEPIKKGIQPWFHFTDEQLFTDQKEEKDEMWGVSPRQVLQFVGTDLVRESFSKLIPGIGKNFWIKVADVWYKRDIHKHKGLVVWTDVRFQNEVDYIKQNGGKVYKIVRPELDHLEENQKNHSSETELDKIKNIDGVIINDGSIKDLYSKLSIFA